MSQQLDVSDAEAEASLERVAALIRDVPDYPTPGVLFRDITPVLADPEAFATVTPSWRRWSVMPMSWSGWKPVGS